MPPCPRILPCIKHAVEQLESCASSRTKPHFSPRIWSQKSKVLRNCLCSYSTWKPPGVPSTYERTHRQNNTAVNSMKRAIKRSEKAQSNDRNDALKNFRTNIVQQEVPMDPEPPPTHKRYLTLQSWRHSCKFVVCSPKQPHPHPLLSSP